MGGNRITDEIEIENINRKNGDLIEVEQLLKEAEALDNDNSNLYRYWAWYHFALFEYDEQIEKLRKALDIDPKDAKTYNSLGRYYKYEKTFDREKAKSALLKAIGLSPGYSTAYYNLANLYNDAKEYEEAEKNYKFAIEKKATNYRAYISLAILLKKLRRPEEAKKVYLELLELNPPVIFKAGTYNNLGMIYIDSGDYSNAEVDLKKGLKLDPDSTLLNLDLKKLLLNNLKTVYENTDRPDEAQKIQTQIDALFDALDDQ